jgi:hypothetical protein
VPHLQALVINLAWCWNRKDSCSLRVDLVVVLVGPEIPQNTGNIARTCAASSVPLHLIAPAFSLSEKRCGNEGVEFYCTTASCVLLPCCSVPELHTPRAGQARNMCRDFTVDLCCAAILQLKASGAGLLGLCVHGGPRDLGGQELSPGRNFQVFVPGNGKCGRQVWVAIAKSTNWQLGAALAKLTKCQINQWQV